MLVRAPTRWSRTPLASWLSHAVLAGLLASCARTENVHETEEARETPCVQCHAAAYAVASSPPHRGAFPETCQTCHATTGWKPAALPEHPWFPLEGKHASSECGGCHTGDPPRYAGTPSDCASCHLPAYQAAQHPIHVGVLPQTCDHCHQVSGWSPATVDEHPWFTLDGKHLTAPCAGCHTGSPKRFAGTPRTCDSCHLADFEGSTFPGHQSFPHTCQDCHKTEGW